MASSRKVPITSLKAAASKLSSRQPSNIAEKLEGRVIVQILPALNHGGVERGTLEIAESVIAAGGKAVVISAGGLLESRLERLGGTHFALPIGSKNPLRWPLLRSRVADILRQEKASLVHIRSRAPAWIALPAARRLGIPVVTTLHGRFVASNPAKRIYNRIMTRGDTVIAISDYIAGEAKRQFPEVAEKLVTIHRGVDTEMFDPAAVPAQRVIALAEQLAVPDGVPIIMLPARPTAWKGFLVLVEALGKMEGKDFLALLVGAAEGDAGFQARLVSRIEALGLGGKVRLCPAVRDMPAAMMLADVIAMPSVTPEPFGRVAIEAMAMGCPVVAFDHGGASETVVHGETGWLAKPNDSKSLAEALTAASSLGPRQRSRLAKAGRSRIETAFTTAMMARQTLSIYRRLTGADS